METQNFKRNCLLILYREGGKDLTLAVCFLLPLKREITKWLALAAYFFHLETPSLPALLPSQLRLNNNDYKFFIWHLVLHFPSIVSHMAFYNSEFLKI